MSTELLTKKEFNLYKEEFQRSMEELTYSVKLGFNEIEQRMNKKFEEVTSGNDVLIQKFTKLEQELVFNHATHEIFDERITKLENPSK